MLRRRPRTDDTNWGPADEVGWHTEQAKAAPGAIAHLLSVPGAWAREIRSIFDDDLTDDDDTG